MSCTMQCAASARGRGRCALALQLGLAALLTSLLGWAPTALAQRSQYAEEESNRRLARAVELFRKGREHDAEEQLKKAISDWPKNVDAIKKYAALLLKRRRLPETAALLQRGLEHNPRDPQLEAYLGVYYCWIGDTRTGLAKFKQVEPYIKKRGAVQFLAAECLLYDGNWTLAAQTLRQSLAAPQGLGALELPLRLRYAVALLRQRNLRAAATQLARLTKQAPKNRQIAALRAELELRRGDCRRALKTYEELNRSSRAYRVELGEAQLCAGQKALAVATLDGYLAGQRERVDAQLSGRVRYPDRPLLRQLTRAALVRGRALRALHRDERALASYDLARRLGGDPAEVGLALAELHFAHGRYRESLARLAPALQDAAAPHALLRLAIRSALRAGDKPAARTYAERLLGRSELDPDDHFVVGVAFKSMGSFERAAPLLERAFMALPRARAMERELAHVWLIQARQDAGVGELVLAISRLERLQGLPSYGGWSVLDEDLALLQLRRGAAEPALKHALAALRRDRRNRRALWLAGRAELALGRPANALKLYGEYSKLATAGNPAIDALVQQEAAVALARAGDLVNAAARLARVELGPAETPAALLLRRNRVRLALISGVKLLAQKKSAQAWPRVERAVAESGALPEGERAALLGRAFFAALQARRLPEARALIASHGAVMGQALLEPLRGAGGALLAALLDCQATDPARKVEGGRKLVELAPLVQPPEDRLPRQTGAAALQQAAYLELGQHRGGATAMRLLADASRLQPTAPPALKHNLAIASYQQGQTGAALKALEALTELVPLALCNLAAHEQNTGQPEKAHDFFKACRRRGGQYPKLDAIIALQDYVFGS
ncbi:MAG: hypothetical protein IPL40_08585 [Proteobacteria bacterium]|nr:hypothetical protein [Pseudomonadota bacterium]